MPTPSFVQMYEYDPLANFTGGNPSRVLGGALQLRSRCAARNGQFWVVAVRMWLPPSSLPSYLPPSLPSFQPLPSTRLSARRRGGHVERDAATSHPGLCGVAARRSGGGAAVEPRSRHPGEP